MQWLVFLLPLLLVGCPPIGEMVEHAGEPTAEVDSTTEPTIEEFQLEPYDGPKARVAVYRFGDRTAKGGGRYSGYRWYSPEIGNGMADMLNDALLKSNRFIVLERQALKDVLQEQDLAATGRVRRETAAPIGQIEGAELLIKGTITEFEPGTRGARGGFGAGGFGLGWGGLLGGALIGGLLSGIQESHVAMVIQVVDTKTSRFLFSTTVEGTASDFDISGLLGGFGRGFGAGAGLGMWQKTPVEKAIRVAILKAVKELSDKTPKTYFRHTAETESALPASPASQPKPPTPQPAVQEVSTQPLKPTSPVINTSGLPGTVIVKVTAANLRDAPGSGGKIVTTLKEGSRLSVQAEDKGWYYIQTQDGKDGWIPKALTGQ